MTAAIHLLRSPLALLPSTAGLRLILLALCSLLPACVLLAPYDETMDRTIVELIVRTETTLARADAGQLSQAESDRFLIESIGTVRALQARAGLYDKNNEEKETLAAVEDRYRALLDRGKPIRTSVATGLRLSLLDLQQIQIAKKRSAALGKKTRSTTSAQ